MYAEKVDRVATVGGFCDHSHIRLNFHQTRDSLAHHRVIVDGENPNPRAATAH
jgi:hypothetical protein